MNFSDGMRQLFDMGVMDSLLPFLLIFTIVYAVLMNTKAIGDGRKPFNLVIALVLAMMVVLPHVTGTYPADKDVVNIINNAIPNVSVIIVAIVLVLLVIGVFGFPLNITKSSTFSTIVILGSFITVLYIFGNAAGWWGQTSVPPFLGFLNDPDTQALLIIVAVFVIVIMYVTGDEKKADQGQLQKGLSTFLDQFGSMLKK